MHTREFLDSVLAQPSDEKLAALVAALLSTHVQEDMWLDYKGGEWSKDVDTKELRKDLTAFGNSDGGCLVVGVAEEKRRPTRLAGCEGDLTRAIQQIDSVIQSVAGYLFPPPRPVRHIKVTGQDVLVIAIPRSGRLHHFMESGTARYYIRIADGTAAIPDYLLSDILFGRRQQPVLGLVSLLFRINSHDNDSIRIDVNLDLQNRGPTYAQMLYTGALFGSLPCESHTALDPGHHLVQKASWKLEPPTLGRGHVAIDPREHGAPTSMIPFTRRGLGYWALLPMVSDGRREWTSVVYAGTSVGPPQWWEVRATMSPDAEVDVKVQEIWGQLPEATYRSVP